MPFCVTLLFEIELNHAFEELDGLGVLGQTDHCLLVGGGAAGRITALLLDLAIHANGVDLFDLDAVKVDRKALIVTAEADEIVVKSSRNIEGVKTTFANLINVYDILNANKLVMDKAALAKIEEVFA